MQIKNLHVQVVTDDGLKPILRDVDLTIDSNQVYVIVDPNGPGKSTLAYSIVGHPDYEVADGEVLLDGVDLLEMSIDERARAGLFLVTQCPIEAPGVIVANLLRTVKTAIDGQAPKMCRWVGEANQVMKNLRMDPTSFQYDVNAGFSGGEKKHFKVLQMELLRPRFAVLNEVDSDLGVDTLRIVSEGINHLHDETDADFLFTTHYMRILRYIKSDHVHVFVDGRVAEAGSPDLADRLEGEGYDHYLARQSSPCQGRRQRAAQQSTVAGPSIETGGLGPLATSDSAVGDRARNRPIPNRKGVS